ncbi:MAG TPA: helix-turn-helix transcriptional regulator [Candidatus Deferrimicrobium sp.]|nr:helix-turn-helix transcriptional regulator [Candidatus Deferrimicrobium sp.]
MGKTGTNMRVNIGQRLRLLRNQYDYSLNEMAGKLGLSRSGYSKNENGLSLPKIETLQRLEKDFDISMNWLFFEKGPIHYKDSLVENGLVKKALSLEKTTPEAADLFAYMEKDLLFRHEIMAFFYKYKNKSPDSQSQEPQMAGVPK